LTRDGPLDRSHQAHDETELLRASIRKLRSGIMAVVFGMTSGMGLFLATIWLVIRGGPVVGPHLGLLGNYFPGYTVTWSGAVIGFFYAAAVGALIGWLVAWIYNLMVDWRRG
jgi:hypothetical protein